MSRSQADAEGAAASAELVARWIPRLRALCDRLRATARGALAEADARGELAALALPQRQGVGDVTYAIDALAEDEVERWLDETAREEPLSLLTEDTGWSHRGPGARGRSRALPGFDHGGARIVLDPIDGTRNLMADLRPAWTVVALCPPGGAQPRMAEAALGLVSEIPDTRSARFRRLSATRGGTCALELRELAGGAQVRAEELPRGEEQDARADHGYFPFFRYAPDLRPDLAALEADFFARLERHEGAQLRHVFDDQYICNAGQLALLALGTYRMVADLRGLAARRRGRQTTTSKPYDIAGAVVCARAAGCALTAPDGSELDFPLDASTPLDFVGWANDATRRRLEPHMLATLAAAAARPA